MGKKWIPVVFSTDNKGKTVLIPANQEQKVEKKQVSLKTKKNIERILNEKVKKDPDFLKKEGLKEYEKKSAYEAKLLDNYKNKNLKSKTAIQEARRIIKERKKARERAMKNKERKSQQNKATPANKG